ncbi:MULTISPECIES: carboxy terminal-processing peptidase [Niastella]|uniref:Carboxy terminal-processing peptidase n=1 Tax=Niastella soli TaxID=2821487 RepID=A0ABS3Z161_9BACT|nr:carboxy terminal-processing peptidase [Niastella soli]MBO9203902.1 carboxy terminal-processing peptidase [Niastella soli]
MIPKKLRLIACTFVLGWPVTGACQELKDPKEYQAVLSAVAAAVKKNHYNPTPFNDELSEQWFQKFLETVDPLKQFFQQSDLVALKKYSTLLDDELQGEKELKFLPAVVARYRNRVIEAGAEYSKLLKEPLHFEQEEYIHYDGSAVSDFAQNANALTDARRRYVKYLVLQKLVQLQNLDTLSRSESQLEEIARQKVTVKLEKWMENKKAEAVQEKLFGQYVNCFTHLMDPHTTYFSTTEAKKFRDKIGNKVAGIGVTLVLDEEGAKIVRLESTGTAAMNGLEADDVIVRVGEGLTGEMTELAGQSSSEIANLVRGEKGTSLRVEIKKPGGKLEIVTMQRSELDPQETAVKALIVRRNNKKVGYISFPIFYQDVDPAGPQVATDVAQAINLLKEQHVDAILFDLRRNGGGSVQEVIRMVSLLIKGGPVVQVRERDRMPVSRSNQDVKMPFGNKGVVEQIYDGPLAVLVDEFSASATEIFASAIQDYKRGVIIGSTSTHGKGTVQRTEPLENGKLGTLNLTHFQFYRINGASTQRKGVIPDIVLPDPNECLKTREKDMPSALAWDMVSPVPYEAWKGKLDLKKLNQFAANRIAGDTAFSIIVKNSAQTCEQIMKDIPLKMDSYKQKLRQQTDLTAVNTRALRLPAGREMDLDVLYPRKNEIWIKGVRQDIYIEQAVAIALEMCNDNK